MRASLGAAVVLTALAAGCLGSDPEAPPGPVAPAPLPRTVAIWVELPRAGAPAAEAGAMLAAVRLAVARHDRQPGDVRVVVRVSDSADPTTGSWSERQCARNAARIADDADAVAVIGTYSSACTAAALPVLNRAGIVLVSPVNASSGLTRGTADDLRRLYPTGIRTFARVVPRDALQGAAAVELAAREQLKRLVLVRDDSARADAVQGQLVAALRGRDMILRMVRRVDAYGELDSVLADLRTAAPDCVVVAARDGTIPGRIVRALARDPAPPRVIATDGAFSDAFLTAAGAAAEGTLVLFGAIPPDRLSGRGADFVEAYTRLHGEPRTYTVAAGEAAGVVLDAIARSDGTREAVARAVLATRFYDGLLGQWSFDRFGDTTLRRVAVLAVRGGRFRFERDLDVPEPAPAG